MAVFSTMKHKPIYSEEAIIYWPYYLTAIGFSCYLVLLIVLGISMIMALVVFSDIITNLLPIVLMAIIIGCCGYGLCKIVKYANIEVAFSNDGVAVRQHPRKNVCIAWADVTEVRYQYRAHFGVEEYFIIYCPSEIKNVHYESHMESLRLSLQTVDKDRIDAFIPAGLRQKP